ncbi:MAG: sulfatase-like hydrolase/transferase, partial [bacterium]|nr:sulfatase-like hydrolase/transferase [bacterium]
MDSDSTPTNPRRFDAVTLLWLLPLLGAILLPGTGRMVREQPMAARIDQAVVMTMMVACLAALVFAAYFYASRRRLRWSLGMAAVTTLTLFQWPWLTSGGGAVHDLIPFAILRDILPVAVTIALLWISSRMAEDLGFAIMTSVTLSGLAIAFTVMSIPYMERASTERGTAAPGSPDVVLIILDGYPREDVLASGFGFDNSTFLSELEARGFFVADEAQSNYSYTFASVSSMFEMDYVFDLGLVDSEEQTVMRKALGGDSELVSLFRSNGYKVGLAENQWEGSHCGPGIEFCNRDGIVERAAWNLGQSSILAPLYSATKAHPFTTVSLGHLESLAETVASYPDDAPVLTIAHILLPHPPLLLDAQCDIVNSPERRDLVTRSAEMLDKRGQYFREQLTCVNRVVLEQLDQILAADEETVVMITGDHGYASAVDMSTAPEAQSPGSIWERMSILSAYRLPGCEGATYPEITPV